MLKSKPKNGENLTKSKPKAKIQTEKWGKFDKIQTENSNCSHWAWGLFAGDDGFDVVEFVECLHWGEVVDVEVENLVADLAEHRVVELEET